MCVLSMLPDRHAYEGKPPGWVGKALALYHSTFDKMRLPSWCFLYMSLNQNILPHSQSLIAQSDCADGRPGRKIELDCLWVC